MNEPLYGWFDKADAPPVYEPPLDTPCPYCGLPCTDDDVRTHSFVSLERRAGRRSYFYRTHQTCDDQASEGEQESIFNGVVEQIAVIEGEEP
jgi:hypothetical protein